MSDLGRTTFSQWFKGLPLGPINGGTNGQSEGNAWPAAFDAFTVTLDNARKQAFPDYAADDALPSLGNDRQLVQGPGELNSSFRVRLKDAWGQWSRAGTACSVLEQLAYYAQTKDVVWIQQNGVTAAFGTMPTPGQDPTSLLNVASSSVLAATLTSTVAPFRTIPAGTPWTAFDGNTDLANRFVIIFKSWPFSALSFAVFNDSDSATVTWPFRFASTSYTVLYGAPTDEVDIYNDGTAQTTTGTTIRSSAKWTGIVWVIGFASGVNPFNTFSTASSGALKRIIQTFRPNATCMGVYAYGTSKGAWAYPIRKWGNGDKWGATAVSQILGSF